MEVFPKTFDFNSKSYEEHVYDVHMLMRGVRLSFIYGFGSGHGVFIATSVPRGALGG
jgi:hypothetical protein